MALPQKIQVGVEAGPPSGLLGWRCPNVGERSGRRHGPSESLGPTTSETKRMVEWVMDRSHPPRHIPVLTTLLLAGCQSCDPHPDPGETGQPGDSSPESGWDTTDTSDNTDTADTADSGMPLSEPPDLQQLDNGVSVQFVRIEVDQSHHYSFTIQPDQAGGTHGLMVSMGTNDWSTNQDMIFSLGLPYPTTDDYPPGEAVAYDGELVNGSRKWASISPGSSNESAVSYPDLAAGAYYVTVHNTSDQAGSYELYYSAW